MDIQIVKISNGWVVTTRTPRGQQAIYCQSWKDVITYLGMVDVPSILKSNQTKVDLINPNDLTEN